MPQQDWSAVGKAIEDRLQDQGMTMTDLANRSGVSLTTVRELVQVLNVRKRNPRTLSALSETLSWPSNHLTKILNGEPVATASPDELSALREELRELRARVEALEEASGIAPGH